MREKYINCMHGERTLVVSNAGGVINLRIHLENGDVRGINNILSSEWTQIQSTLEESVKSREFHSSGHVSLKHRGCVLFSRWGRDNPLMVIQGPRGGFRGSVKLYPGSVRDLLEFTLEEGSSHAAEELLAS